MCVLGCEMNTRSHACTGFSYFLLLGGWVVEDVIDPPHLDPHSAIAERIANGRQPGGQGTEGSYCLWICGRHHREIDVYVENDGPNSDEVVQLRATETDQSGREGGREDRK